MSDPTYTDLLIADGDITLDAGGQPLLVYDRACIAQDIVHMILETGLLVELVGERDIRKRKKKPSRRLMGRNPRLVL